VTEEKLLEIERQFDEFQMAPARKYHDRMTVDPADVAALIAEVRRLREELRLHEKGYYLDDDPIE
jgi:hypothetical protein